MTPRRIVAIGILVLALSGIGFAVVEAMHPITRDEHVAMVRLAIQRKNGEISDEERDRQVDALEIGVCGRFLTRRAYGTYRVLALGGALAGFTLIAAGTIRTRRQRSVATPPGS